MSSPCGRRSRASRACHSSSSTKNSRCRAASRRKCLLRPSTRRGTRPPRRRVHVSLRVRRDSPMKLIRRILIGIVALVALLYLGGVGYIYFAQRGLQYDVAGKFLDLGETRLNTAEVVEIPTSGNERI